MPIYTYRREDGTTFEIRQKFSDDPLETDPKTGQPVTRIIQNAGIIFKGSGFYVNDSKGSKKTALPSNGDGNGTGENGAKPDAKSENGAKPDAKSDTKAETKSEKPAKKSEKSSS